MADAQAWAAGRRALAGDRAGQVEGRGRLADRPRKEVFRLVAFIEPEFGFHQRIIELSGCETLRRTAGGILIHVRSIRHRTIAENQRFKKSIVDHLNIIESLEARNADLAERLVRDHALALAAHVNANDNDL